MPTHTRLRVELPPRYRVLHHIATGGMASVYAVRDEVLARDVAVKVLAEAYSADDVARRRFTREARAAARVGHHPNVATIFDITEWQDSALIVMELLDGGSLAERLREGGPIPHALALRWLEQTAAALDAAHLAGMVHRDVKPANLLLDDHGILKVADFGIAIMANDLPITRTGQVIGTAAYLSPEQASGRSATAASDRYALAVVAFELLTGQRPFPQGPPAAQAIAHLDREPPAATSIAPGLPSGVDAVLARGMAKDPDDRPPTAAALVGELRAALEPTAATGAAVPVSAPAPGTEETRVAPAEPSRNHAGRIAVGAALLLVLGAIVAAIAGNGDEPRSARGAVDRHPTAPRQANAEQPATTATHPPASTASTPPTTTASARLAGVPADAAAEQAAAHAQIDHGDYAGAVATLRGMVPKCDVHVTDPCAYAWFDLGYALRRSGYPQLAVAVLERRLQNPDQRATVQAELDAARAQAARNAEHPEPPDKPKQHGPKPKNHGDD